MNPRQPAIPIDAAPRCAAKYIDKVMGFALSPKGPIMGWSINEVDTSVKALVKDIMPPATIPGIIKGMMILERVVIFEAPRFCAASSNVMCTCLRTA